MTTTPETLKPLPPDPSVVLALALQKRIDDILGHTKMEFISDFIGIIREHQQSDGWIEKAGEDLSKYFTGFSCLSKQQAIEIIRRHRDGEAG